MGRIHAPPRRKIPKWLCPRTLRWLAEGEMDYANAYKTMAYRGDWRSKSSSGMDAAEAAYLAEGSARLALAHRFRSIRYRNMATRVERMR